jgi:hypothetical protein
MWLTSERLYCLRWACVGHFAVETVQNFEPSRDSTRIDDNKREAKVLRQTGFVLLVQGKA